MPEYGTVACTHLPLNVRPRSNTVLITSDLTTLIKVSNLAAPNLTWARTVLYSHVSIRRKTGKARILEGFNSECNLIP